MTCSLPMLDGGGEAARYGVSAWRSGGRPSASGRVTGLAEERSRAEALTRIGPAPDGAGVSGTWSRAWEYGKSLSDSDDMVSAFDLYLYIYILNINMRCVK